ncbi:MAG TPA: addiction module toxin RelE [Desulfobulbaceae bacterium]|nr:addiction module toxin RelE [Desulfobulbaceae bacterium]
MKWEVEYTDEFGEWWETLSEDEQESIAVSIGLLEIMGPNLPRPHSDTVKGSRFNMKELRTQHAGKPYRTLYTFDPRRMAMLLIGGYKTGNDDWYQTFIPIADRLFEEHLEALKKEEN